jgi:hypothetical protein
MTKPDPAAIREMFTPGQQVEVRQDGVYQGTGTVVGYARCESFTVREPDFGTVCDFHYTELTPAPQADGGQPR